MAKLESNIATMSSTNTPLPSKWIQWCLFVFIIVWLGFQILFPLRHFLYPGSPSWNEEGHRFAWQMKLRDKEATAEFYVRDPKSGKEWPVNPKKYLLRHQERKMVNRPDMILQFAHYLAEIWSKKVHTENLEVRARVCASLNGRRAQLLIDPDRDLAKVKRNLKHADWIIPLHQPFERPANRKYRRDISC